MERRPLGATGLAVTPIGLGLAALGRPAYITPHRTADLQADRPVEALGTAPTGCSTSPPSRIGYIDVARSYGLAERFLADWLQGYPTTEMTIGS